MPESNKTTKPNNQASLQASPQGNTPGPAASAIQFSGFDEWIPIFAGGKQTDSQGREQDGDRLIDQALSSFDPAYHEPPAVVGHPKDNSPSFAWVSNLKKGVENIKGLGKVNVLFAKFKDVVPEFAQAVQSGLYKKRSASFYPDGRLRHVGFLGAMPPAVKGLADLQFIEDEQAIEFSEFPVLNFHTSPFIWNSIAKIFRSIRENLIEKSGKEEADKVIPEYILEDFNYEANRKVEEVPTQPLPSFKEKETQGMAKTYTEEELQHLLEAREQVVAVSFSEQMTAAKLQARKEVEAEFAKKARKQEISNSIETGLKSGTIIPAWQDMGLANFMEALQADQPIEFAEGQKATPYEFFKNFLSGLPKMVEFGEIATRGSDPGASGLDQKRDSAIADFMEKHQGASYKEAVLAVSKAQPTLFEEVN